MTATVLRGVLVARGHRRAPSRRRVACLFMLAMGVVLLLAAPARAEVDCYDNLGRKVTWVEDRSIQDIANSSLDPATGAPIIRYNPDVRARFSAPTVEWFDEHECGHHARGHLNAHLGENMPVERDADCYATKTLVQSGQFSGRDLAVVQHELATTKGDYAHLPGVARDLDMGLCLRSQRPAPFGAHRVTEQEFRDAFNRLGETDQGPEARSWELSVLTGLGWTGMSFGAASGSMIDFDLGMGLRKYVWFDRDDEDAMLGFDVGGSLGADVSGPSPVGLQMRVGGSAAARIWLSYLGLLTFVDESVWNYQPHAGAYNGGQWSWRTLAGVGATLSTAPASRRFLANLTARWAPWLDGSKGTLLLSGTLTVNALGFYVDVEYYDALRGLDGATSGWLGAAGVLIRF